MYPRVPARHTWRLFLPLPLSPPFSSLLCHLKKMATKYANEPAVDKRDGEREREREREPGTRRTRRICRRQSSVFHAIGAALTVWIVPAFSRLLTARREGEGRHFPTKKEKFYLPSLKWRYSCSLRGSADWQMHHPVVTLSVTYFPYRAQGK